MEQQSPITPKSRMKPRKSQNVPFLDCRLKNFRLKSNLTCNTYMYFVIVWTIKALHGFIIIYFQPLILNFNPTWNPLEHCKGLTRSPKKQTNLNASLPFGQAALTLCLPRAIAFISSKVNNII